MPSSGSSRAWVGPSRDHLQLIYDELEAALKTPLDELSGLDQKATIMLAPLGVLLGLGVNAAPRVNASAAAEWVYAAGLFGLLVGLLAGILALRLRTLKFAPLSTGIWPDYATEGTEASLADFCAAVADAIKENDPIRGQKTPFIRLEYASLGLGAVLLGAALAVQALGILR